MIGERRIDEDGYVHLYTRKGWKSEHRLIMARMLGRPLRRGENVHHRNGKRWDNRPSNLELWVKVQPAGVRARELRCPHCGKRYDAPRKRYVARP